MDQQRCNWPSGREIRRFSVEACLEVLAGFGVEGPQVRAMRMSELRALIHQLKRESPRWCDCECPAAAYIRAGGGTARS